MGSNFNFIKIIIGAFCLVFVCLSNAFAQNVVVRRNGSLSTKNVNSHKNNKADGLINRCSPGNAVDLGLSSGTLWADRNVGASAETNEGRIVVWGDASGTKLKSPCPETVSNISHTAYDIATVKWGKEWKIPTRTQVEELVKTCYIERTTKNGVVGYTFIGRNGNSIFFPCSSHYSKNRFDGKPYVAFWTANSDVAGYGGAYFMWLEDGLHDILCWAKSFRFSVRPVK